MNLTPQQDASTWATVDVALDTISPNDRALAAKVWAIVSAHDKNHPIRAREIAEKLGLEGLDPERDVQSIVGILSDAGLAIGSSWGKPPGYYKIEDVDDLFANGFKFLRRSASIRRRGLNYLRLAIRAPFVGQGELKFKDGPK